MAKKSNQTNNEEILCSINPFNIWVFCFFLSTIFLLICTKSSPLYPFNDWVDANCIFTVGKGMMNGQVPYRDLYEQKGPFIYLIFGFAYLFSNMSFWGVFLFEVISFAILLFYCNKLALLFVDTKQSLILLPLITICILNLKSFSNGGSAEEFCLPLLAISLYYLLKYFENIYPKHIPQKWLLINGIIAGCVLWIKFSLLGFWLGWILSIIFLTLKSKLYRHAIKGALIFLLGMLIASLPWIIYFGINNSIIKWIEVYIINSFKYYRTSTDFRSAFNFIITHIFYHYIQNPITNTLLWFGIVVFASVKKLGGNRLTGICLLFCILLLIAGIYGGGRGYVYYFLIISPLIILGFLNMLDIIGKFVKIKSIRMSRILIIIILIAGLPLTLKFHHNTYMLKWDKQDLVQYKFASIINQTEQPTLLNYDFLDGGFYTTTGITPNIRFFQTYNLDNNEMGNLVKESQIQYIRARAIEYIVMQLAINDKNKYLSTPYLMSNYELIKVEEQENEYINYSYLLFKKRDGNIQNNYYR